MKQKYKLSLLVTAVAITGSAVASDATQNVLYRLGSATVLPGTDSGWDYIKMEPGKMEPGSPRLFMARDQGLSDTHRRSSETYHADSFVVLTYHPDTVR